jgi:hypothetical protein
LTSIKIKFFERTAKYTLFDYNRNEGIFKDLKVTPFYGNLGGYKSHWLRYVTRMNSNRMQKVMLNYKQNGLRLLGKILKRLFR